MHAKGFNKTKYDGLITYSKAVFKLSTFSETWPRYINSTLSLDGLACFSISPSGLSLCFEKS